MWRVMCSPVNNHAGIRHTVAIVSRDHDRTDAAGPFLIAISEMERCAVKSSGAAGRRTCRAAVLMAGIWATSTAPAGKPCPPPLVAVMPSRRGSATELGWEPAPAAPPSECRGSDFRTGEGHGMQY